jgi:hypothetical protein
MRGLSVVVGLATKRHVGRHHALTGCGGGRQSDHWTNRRVGGRPMRVVLCDDSALFREGLARLLADEGVTVTGQAPDVD